MTKCKSGLPLLWLRDVHPPGRQSQTQLKITRSNRQLPYSRQKPYTPKPQIRSNSGKYPPEVTISGNDKYYPHSHTCCQLSCWMMSRGIGMLECWRGWATHEIPLVHLPQDRVSRALFCEGSTRSYPRQDNHSEQVPQNARGLRGTSKR